MQVDCRPAFTEYASQHPSVRCRAKRIVDIIGSLVGLGLTSILFIPIVLAIQLDDPGPIFFCQERCGLNGKIFHIWKFRSMVADAERLKKLVKNQAKGHFFKNHRDPRITRVGRILRRTSLDELPQFWNVLRGDMSLVGTRPPTIAEVSRYQPHHYLRLRVKPGMTGEWQVSGRSAITDFEEVVRLDIAYQIKWSLLYDLQVILKTFPVLISRKGAY
jgi:lipopolysaccharide/colanic/teichoic acid biosynthesis glycosyltransferase